MIREPVKERRSFAGISAFMVSKNGSPLTMHGNDVVRI